MAAVRRPWMAVTVSPPVAVLARRMVDRMDEHRLVRDLVRELEPDVGLDRLEPLDVLLARKADRVAGRSGARRAPHSMHIVLGVEREVVVDDVGHALDVEPA